MTYENKAFPLVSGSAYNHYNQRGLEDGLVSGGKLPSTGTEYQAVVYATGEDFADGATYTTRLQLPKGAKVTGTSAEVTEAFELGGTSPTITVGLSGSSAADTAVSLAEADLETAGYVEVGTAPTGQLDDVLAADAFIEVVLGGTSPTVTSDGRLKVVINYTKL